VRTAILVAVCSVGSLARAAPPAETTPAVPLCEPVVRCGCYTGCGEFVSLGGSLPDPRYKLVHGDDAIFTRAAPDQPLRVATEACDKTCPQDLAPPFQCARNGKRVCEKKGANVEAAPRDLASQARAHAADLDACFDGQPPAGSSVRLQIERGRVTRALPIGVGGPAARCVRKKAAAWRFEGKQPTKTTDVELRLHD
jgi:hypothetical protein